MANLKIIYAIRRKEIRMKHRGKVTCDICGKDITNTTRYRLTKISGVKKGPFEHKTTSDLCANCCAVVSLVNKTQPSVWEENKMELKFDNEQTFADVYNKLP